MPVSPDVSAIVEELLDADLAWLAAEVIQAIELPQPTHVTSGDVVDHPRLAGFQAGMEMRFDVLSNPVRESLTEDEKTPDLNDAQQLVVATDVIRIRLVEPSLRLLEAERIASRIQAAGPVRDRERREPRPDRPKQVRFGLQGGDGSPLVNPEDFEVIEDLSRLLLEISDRTSQPRPSRGEA